MSEAKKRAPGRPRSEASREAILDAAYWQTMERGYSLVTAESIARAAEQAAEGTDPPADLNASAEYKAHLARVLCKRALLEAAGL